MNSIRRRNVGVMLVFSLAALIGACGADSTEGVRLISADEAFETLTGSPPEGLVVLDVRTPEEFNTQRIDNAVMIGSPT